MPRCTSIILLLIMLLFARVGHAEAVNDKPLTIFAAASLKEALDEITTEFEKNNKVKVRISYAASSTLARQIQAGAPADIFFSADEDWMNYLQKNQAIRISTRQALLSNQLVLISSKSNPHKAFKISAETDLKQYLSKNDRLAVAATHSVPAGKYAKASLENLGLWNDVSPRIVETDNVRSCLLLVSRGEAALGITYKTDALIDPRVKILATFPDASHPAIIYPVAATTLSKSDKTAPFLKWLNGPEARSIFIRYGFKPVSR